ncbi:hypothetical protein Cni_G12221 [Canna indica]|uniref:Phthiocerol/phthiodiolone dimycocerosyl transferase C-terminal domain-containing protein n=1 Tax=Canna indica TaxID=4628 RepID=A0AAQ3Q8U3_9LILI|nr:hypothetical protein Cni_G12221 [Canna indica]
MDASLNRRSEVARLVFGVEETQKLLTSCKAKGLKLCGAIAAAAMVATHSSKHLENDQNETYTVATLVDCRKDLDPVLNGHNFGKHFQCYSIPF